MIVGPMERDETQNSCVSFSLAAGISLMLAALSATLRWVPHPAGLSGMGALGLYSSGRFGFWKSLAIMASVMTLTSLGLWAYTGHTWYSPVHVTQAYVLPSLAFYAFLGLMLRKSKSTWAYAGAGLAGALAFFVLTNFFEWFTQPWREDVLPMFRYSRDLAGLSACYIAALPFFNGQLLADPWQFVVGNPSYGIYGTILGDVLLTTLAFSVHDSLVRRPQAAPSATVTTLSAEPIRVPISSK